MAMVQRTTNTLDDSDWGVIFDKDVHGELGGVHQVTALDGPGLLRIEGVSGDNVFDQMDEFDAGPPVEGAEEIPENGVRPIATGAGRIDRILGRAIAGGSVRFSIGPIVPGRGS